MYSWRVWYAASDKDDIPDAYVIANDMRDAARQAALLASLQGNLVARIEFELCLHAEGEDASKCPYMEWN